MIYRISLALLLCAFIVPIWASDDDCNYGLLRAYAETFNAGVWAGLNDSQQKIEEGYLDFLPEQSAASISHISPADFQTKLSEYRKLLTDPIITEEAKIARSLGNFIDNCETIFTASESTPLKRKAVDMLLTKTLREVNKDLCTFRAWDAIMGCKVATS